MDYRILGPLDVSDGERPIALGGEKQRALLAMLLLRAGEVVSADRLIDDLWGERAPAAAHNALQVHISRLRKALEANGPGARQSDGEGFGRSSGGLLITRGRGYLLRVEPGELDLDRFRVLVEEGRRALAAGDAPRAAEALRAGLELWRGAPLADFAYEPFAEAPITELEELRLGAVEDRVEADLALGRGQQLIGELTTLVAQNPLRERLRGQLMLALYRCDRQPEALDVYQEFRRGLAEELGLDPGPGLRELNAAILQRDRSLELRASIEDRVDGGSAGVGTGPDAPAVDGRAGGFRTFLLADIRGYSSFAVARGDEAAAALTERFAALAETAVSEFGGVNIGTRGDEVLIAFESPRQAVRAAAALTQALLEATREDPALPLPAGIGLDVGEAVIVADGWRANAINVAARLCSLAKGGEILATREVTHLAQAVEGIRYLPQPAARLKGIPETVAAMRIVADAGDPASGFAELGLTHAAAPPVHRPWRRGTGIAAGTLVLLVVVAVVVTLVSRGGGWSVIAGNSVGAIDPGGGTVSADVLVGSSPSGVAVGQGSVWVTNYNAGTVSRIDLATHAVEPIQVGSTPTGIAVGANAVWVANRYSDTVSRIDPAGDGVLATIPVGSGPGGVAVGDGYVWVANSIDGTLSRIDPLSDRPTTIPLGGGTEPTGVAVGQGAVWVSDAADGRVLRVDPNTYGVTPINVGNGPSAITVAYHSVWVVDSLEGNVWRINPKTNTVTVVVPVGRDPSAVAAGACGVWVANELGGTVVRIDPKTNTPGRPIAVGNSPRGLAVEGGLVWVSAEPSVTPPVPTTGPGLTQPTRPPGARVPGGTVFFTEIPNGGSPNYIFPMYSGQYCGTNNIGQFMDMMYRPLYWYGNNYRPTVDYGYSIARAPAFSDGGKTVTITLNPGWRWSDGEAVTSRDLVFWMNVLKVNVLNPNPANQWCGYAPGYFPDNVTGYSAPDPHTFVMHFNRAYDQTWVLYNELSQLTPLPLAWDRTSLSQPAPRSDNGHLPDTTRAGAAAIYKFLDRQGKSTGTWASSHLWSVVDGPFKLQSFTRTGQVTLVPNPSYWGSPKPTISKLVERPYANEEASYLALRSYGPSEITVANIPSQYAAAIPTLTAEGYELNPAASYSFNYFPLNFNSSAPTSPGGEPVRFIFTQLYFRRALQHLVDQQGWITAFSNGTRNPTCGPIPLSPPSPLVNLAAISTAPCDFSVATARHLLTANGWKVVPGGATTCVRPGTGAGECGAGIKAGEGISFTVDYLSFVPSVHDEMNDLAAQARRVGINLRLTTHDFGALLSAAVPCAPNQSTCKWTAENWGAGSGYGPGYLPTGEPLYDSGAAGNAGSYSDPKMTQLIRATTTMPARSEARALTAYDNYAEQQLPVVFQPTQIGTYFASAANAGTLVSKKLGGYAANALGLMNPEDWYFTR